MSINENRFEIRPYEDGDEHGIVKAWEKTFGRPMSLDHWNWKYRQAPIGESVIFVVFDRETNEITGHLAAIPAKATLLGRSILAYQPVDGLMTGTSAGRGYFGHMFEFILNAVCDTKSVVSYAAPNHQSFHAVVKQAKHIKLTYLSRYSLSANSLLKRWYQIARLSLIRARNSGADAAIEIDNQATVPEDYDSLWRAARRNEILSIWKDKDYLEWRFENCPDKEFRFATARINGKLKALLVYTTDAKGVTSFAEVICEFSSEKVAQHLVASTCLQLFRNGGRRVGFYGASAGFYSQIFDVLDERTTARFPILIRYLGDDSHVEKLMENPSNWIVSWGDTDIV